MKTSRIGFLGIAVVAGLFGLSGTAEAGGAGDPLASLCTVTSAAGQSLTGTAAITYQGHLGGTRFTSAEVTLALQREHAGTPEFFRAVISPGVPPGFSALTPQGVACQIIAAMGADILTRFYGSATGRTLKILEDSITETDGHAPLVPGDPNAQTAVAQIRLLVQSP